MTTQNKYEKIAENFYDDNCICCGDHDHNNCEEHWFDENVFKAHLAKALKQVAEEARKEEREARSKDMDEAIDYRGDQ